MVIWEKQNIKLAIHIEFQERSRRNFYPFKWIFNAPNIEIAAYIEFIEKTTNA